MSATLAALVESLRLLCVNHYFEMQDYMRTQPDNLRSYNMVRTYATRKSKASTFFTRHCYSKLDRKEIGP